MGEKSSKDGTIPWPALLALVVAAGSAAVLFRNLQSSRPAESARHGDMTLDCDDVRARLWQDPFAAVDEAIAERSGDAPMRAVASAKVGGVAVTLRAADGAGEADRCHSAAALRDLLNAPVTGRRAARRCVMVVTVPASRYAESVEQRLRVRVAVLEGLARSGYVPRNGERLGYARVPWPSTEAFGRDVVGGSTTAPSDRAAGAKGEADRQSLTVPYEWCDADGLTMATTTRPSGGGVARYASVLVLWVDEAAIGDLPLARCAWLLSHLRGGGGGTGGANGGEDAIEPVVLGPRFSGTMRAVVHEWHGWSRAPQPRMDVYRSLRGARFLTSTATAEDALLDQRRMAPSADAADPEAPRDKAGTGRADLCGLIAQDLDERLGLPWEGPTAIRLLRTTIADCTLCDALVAELKRRHIAVGPAAGAAAEYADVAIVSEWDTYYGRALPVSFAASAYYRPGSKAAGDVARRNAVLRGEQFPRWIHPFYYLRGIDGRVPEREGKGAQGEASGGSDSAETKGPAAAGEGKRSAPAEMSEGTNGTDYLRRLSEDLLELDRRLRREGKGGLQAVGVLGTDLYDKLLILAALRAQLPGVTFFTTSIDARYGLGGEWAKAHNLVIASAYGLSLHEFYQRSLPPFRDSEQTAVFAATLLATGEIWPSAADAPRPSDAAWDGRWAESVPCLFTSWNGAPRLFEIARGGAFDLTVNADLTPEGDPVAEGKPPVMRNVVRGAGAHCPAEVPTLHPPRWNAYVWMSEWRLGCILGAVCCAVATAAWLIFDCGVRPRRGRWVGIVTLPPLFGAMAAIIGVSIAWQLSATQLGGPEGEPLVWFQGISVWPTEVVRLVIVALAVSFIWRTHARLARSDAEIQKEFQLPSADTPITIADARFTPAPGKTADAIPTYESGFVLAVKGWPVYAPEIPLASETDLQTLDVDSARGIIPESEVPEDEPRRVYAANLWVEYRRRSEWLARWIRVLLPLALTLIAAALVVLMFGAPVSPARGSLAWGADVVMTILASLSTLVVGALVLDATYVNKKFIEYLMETETRWPDGLFDGPEFGHWRLGRDLTEYLDVRLIARRTKVAGEAVYYPPVLFILLVGARNSFFDDWHWPTGLVIVFVGYMLLAVASAYLLRRAAESARAQALEKMRDRRVARVAAKDETGVKSLDEAIRRVEEEREGAFSILSQYPTLAAILLPSGSFGLWALVEYLAKSAG